MTGGLLALLDAGGSVAAAWLLVFLRIGAATALVPAFGEQSLPVRLRLAVALCLTAIVAPAVGPEIERTLDGPVSLPAAAGVEVVAGLALGIAFRLLVHGLQTAGTIAANMTSLSQILGGAGADPQPAMSALLVMAGLALAVGLGLHVKLALALADSYRTLPAGTMPPAGDLAAWGTERVAATFRLAFVLAAPFTVAALVYNLALGAVSRAMPQLMVALVGAPAISWAALALFAVSAPHMLAVWNAALDAALAAPFGPP